MHCHDLQQSSLFPLLSTPLPCATTCTLKSSGFPCGRTRMGEADFQNILLLSQGIALLFHPLTPLLQYTQLKLHSVTCQTLHKNTLLRQARKPKINLYVVIVTPDERLRVNNTWGKKISGKLVICCEIWGWFGSNASLHLGLQQTKLQEVCRKKKSSHKTKMACSRNSAPIASRLRCRRNWWGWTKNKYSRSLHLIGCQWISHSIWVHIMRERKYN